MFPSSEENPSPSFPPEFLSGKDFTSGISPNLWFDTLFQKEEILFRSQKTGWMRKAVLLLRSSQVLSPILGYMGPGAHESP